METETCFQETKFCFQCLMFGNENVFPGNRFPFLGMKTGFLFPMFCAIIRLHRNLFSLSNQPFTHSLTHFIGCFISPPVHFIQIITCHLKNINLISLTLFCSYHLECLSLFWLGINGLNDDRSLINIRQVYCQRFFSQNNSIFYVSSALDINNSIVFKQKLTTFICYLFDY